MMLTTKQKLVGLSAGEKLESIFGGEVGLGSIFGGLGFWLSRDI